MSADVRNRTSNTNSYKRSTSSSSQYSPGEPINTTTTTTTAATKEAAEEAAKERLKEILKQAPPAPGLKLVHVVETVEETTTTSTKKKNRRHRSRSNNGRREAIAGGRGSVPPSPNPQSPRSPGLLRIMAPPHARHGSSVGSSSALSSPRSPLSPAMSPAPRGPVILVSRRTNNALLADLHSTTTHIASYQHRQQNDSTPPPPPLPPPPSQDVLDGLHNDEPVYEVQQVRSPVHSTTITVSKNRYPNPNGNAQNMAGAGNGHGQQGGALSNNISELDSLLQDLSSAQFMAEVDKRNAANTHGQPQRSVDSLLSELEDTLPPHRQGQGGGAGHYEVVNSKGPRPAASTATRELDDLMASLSDFKMSGTPKHVGEPPYAQPHKLRAQPASEEMIQPSVAKSAQAGSMNGGRGSGDNLDAMLGTLSDDLSRQGITTVPKGHCAACTKPIVGQVITALAKMWHPEHFTCHHCNETLGTQNFFERDSVPYCERDYHQLFSPKCAACQGPILDKCVTALEKTWHPEHFVCAHCHKPFGEDGFHDKDGKPYCRTDFFEMFAPKCGGCQRPIMDNYISALSKQWHPECFVCRECHMAFGSASFYEHNGFPYCETHYHARRGSLCASCSKPITGRCITAMYRKFHPEHFVCAFCLQQLNKGTFKEQNDKPYCHPCFVKLFG